MDDVDEFMGRLDHPFKAEIEEIRTTVKGVNKGITEQVKWNAPTFSYRGQYLVTFNLHEKKRIHLVFHHPAIEQVDSRILEGTMTGRRMAYFADLAEVKAKRAALKDVIRKLVKATAG